MEKYAIVETGSKQYWVEPGMVFDVERLERVENQKEVALSEVLFAKDAQRVLIGEPILPGARIICEYLGEIRGKKVISLKYRRRKASRNRKGHRQTYARLRVKEIQI